MSKKITSGAVFAAITKPRSRADPVRSSTAHASANGGHRIAKQRNGLSDVEQSELALPERA